MRKYFAFLVVLFTVFLMGAKGNDGCMQRNSDDVQREQQEKILAEGTSQIGMPAVKNFRERKLLKMIIELRDKENFITYVYTEDMSGGLHFRGKAIGYPIPYATQFTNPMKYDYNGTTTPQADPNGLFSPADAEGTWVMLIDPKGNPRPVYFEPRVICSPFPLK
jgi:hypothetical protein